MRKQEGLRQGKVKKSYGYLTAASFHFSYWQLLLAGYILSLADHFSVYFNFQLTSATQMLRFVKFYVCLDYLLYFITLYVLIKYSLASQT